MPTRYRRMIFRKRHESNFKYAMRKHWETWIAEILLGILFAGMIVVTVWGTWL